MKISVRVVQIVVGLLFIVSGLVKANDPLGLSYKMQEFFELWNSGLAAGHFFARQPLIVFFDFLHDHSLFLSVAMITLEVGTGVALLLAWRRRFILGLLLVLILFFSFLTGYAYLSGKFTNCGCFGDCLPISPLASFTKDLVLLAGILWLLLGQRYLAAVFPRKAVVVSLTLSVLLTLLLQIYVLHYLPLVDCLPFRKGNNIAEQMKPPPGSVPDSTDIVFLYEKGGKRYTFRPSEFPADLETYSYINREDRLVRKGNAEPRIKGFSLTDTSGSNYTDSVLAQRQALVLFVLDLHNRSVWVNGLHAVAKSAAAKGIPLYLATALPEEADGLLAAEGLPLPVYACDFTVIRTAARTNPVLYELKSGTIVNKWGMHDLKKAAASLNR